MTDFKVGDTVRCVAPCDGRVSTVGLVGTVVDIYRGDIGVEFDQKCNGHDCSRHGRNGYCWYFHDGGHEYLTLVSEPDIEIKTTFDDIFGGEV